MTSIVNNFNEMTIKLECCKLLQFAVKMNFSKNIKFIVTKILSHHQTPLPTDINPCLPVFRNAILQKNYHGNTDPFLHFYQIL